jgi:hypothetical protein
MILAGNAPSLPPGEGGGEGKPEDSPLSNALSPNLSWRERGKKGRRVFVLALAGLALLSGCSSTHDTPPTLIQSPVYSIPAPELARDVKQIVEAPPISLPAEDKGDGSFLTGWQEPFRGDFHVVRYWHERTRYHISVVPDFADPSHRSRLQITDESEQRPDEGGPNVEAKTWHPAPNNRRPERAEDLLHQIQAKLEAPVATRPAQ